MIANTIGSAFLRCCDDTHNLCKIQFFRNTRISTEGTLPRQIILHLQKDCSFDSVITNFYKSLEPWYRILSTKFMINEKELQSINKIEAQTYFCTMDPYTTEFP